MHLVRELLLLLVCGVMGLWAPGLLGGPGPQVAFFLTGVMLALPFQAGYAVALLAARRAPVWLVGLLGIGAWGVLVAPVWVAGSAAPRLTLVQAAVPVILAAVAAALRPGRDRRLQAAAGAMYAWAFTRWTVGWVLLRLASGAAEQNRQLLLLVGSLYLTLRVLAALVWPMQGDFWFEREER